MQLGLVGLGKMGFNMRERLRKGGHEVIGYDPRPEVTDVPDLAGLAAALTAPRVVWVMVPSGEVTNGTIVGLAEALSAG
nr:NAD(P)-binding domain-containing protein [Actinomycetota bacterium]